MGFAQGPWHDATTCVSGPAAAALGELAATRWKLATGEKLEPVNARSDPWPDGLDPDFEDIGIGIARTQPEYEDQHQTGEIQTAKLAMIKTARKSVYIESQYFASRVIAEAIAERLAEEDGPEVVVINPEGAEGWLEAKFMDSARIRLMKLVRNADRHGPLGHAIRRLTRRTADLFRRQAPRSAAHRVRRGRRVAAAAAVASSATAA